MRTKAELDQVIEWLTGFDEAALRRHSAERTTFEDFFADTKLHSHAALITSVVCGVRVEDVDDPLMQKIRYLDKLVDEFRRHDLRGGRTPVQETSAASRWRCGVSAGEGLALPVTLGWWK